MRLPFRKKRCSCHAVTGALYNRDGLTLKSRMEIESACGAGARRGYSCPTCCVADSSALTARFRKTFVTTTNPDTTL